MIQVKQLVIAFTALIPKRKQVSSGAQIPRSKQFGSKPPKNWKKRPAGFEAFGAASSYFGTSKVELKSGKEWALGWAGCTFPFCEPAITPGVQRGGKGRKPGMAPSPRSRGPGHRGMGSNTESGIRYREGARQRR